MQNHRNILFSSSTSDDFSDLQSRGPPVYDDWFLNQETLEMIDELNYRNHISWEKRRLNTQNIPWQTKNNLPKPLGFYTRSHHRKSQTRDTDPRFYPNRLYFSPNYPIKKQLKNSNSSSSGTNQSEPITHTPLSTLELHETVLKIQFHTSL